MGIKAKFTAKQVEMELARRSRSIEAAIIRRLQFLGEKCLIECRTNKSYQDQTGNLTSSMGYVVVANGMIVQSHGFNQGVQSLSGNSGTAVGKSGMATGQALAKEVAQEFRTGYALIVVAGMNYAAAVEAKGYNVLTSAELLAEKEMPRMMKALSQNIEKMK